MYFFRGELFRCNKSEWSSSPRVLFFCCRATMLGASGKAEPPPPPLLHLLLVGLFYHLATAQGTAPCYECDEFKEIHPNYSPAEEVSLKLFPFLLGKKKRERCAQKRTCWLLSQGICVCRVSCSMFFCYEHRTSSAFELHFFARC
jgi:hypothetical protein